MDDVQYCSTILQNVSPHSYTVAFDRIFTQLGIQQPTHGNHLEQCQYLADRVDNSSSCEHLRLHLFNLVHSICNRGPKPWGHGDADADWDGQEDNTKRYLAGYLRQFFGHPRCNFGRAWKQPECLDIPESLLPVTQPPGEQVAEKFRKYLDGRHGHVKAPCHPESDQRKGEIYFRILPREAHDESPACQARAFELGLD